MKNLICLFVFVLFALTVSGQKELCHNDPYKLDGFIYLYMPFEKSYVQEHRLKSVKELHYERIKDTTHEQKGDLQYFITYNTSNNPVQFHEPFTFNVGKWPRLLQKLRIRDKHTLTNDYLFDYDSLGRLVHMKEVNVDSYRNAYEQTDLKYFYHKDKVVEEHIIGKTIWTPGFKHRGVTYTNDTSWVMIKLDYDSADRVTGIFYHGWIDDRVLTRGKPDTVKYMHPFDSIFIPQTMLTGTMLDAEGNITQQAVYRFPGEKGLSDTLFINHYFYNQRKQLTEIKRFDHKNTFLNSVIYSYNSAGMLISVYYSDRKSITKYIYETY